MRAEARAGEDGCAEGGEKMVKTLYYPNVLPPPYHNVKRVLQDLARGDLAVEFRETDFTT